MFEFALLGALIAAAVAAEPPTVPVRGQASERYGGPPSPRRAATPGLPVLRDGTARQVNVTAAGLNIIGDAANETSIAVDPTAPNRIVIAWRQFDSIASNFRQAGYGYSLDGGRSWSAHTLDPGVFRTDPVIRFDADGVLLWNSLYVSPTDTYRCDLFRSFDAGRSWSGPVFCYGGDKSWMAIDRSEGGRHGNVYQAWNIAGNPTPGMTFNRSLTRGLTWSVPQAVPASPCWGQVAIGPAGEVCVNGTPNAGGTAFYFTKSLNAGDPLATPSFTPAVTVGMGGSLLVNPGTGFPNPGGLQGIVSLCVDSSNGPRRGWIYMLASARPPATDPADIRFARSADGGQTWSASTRINSDPLRAGAWQWFGTMSVAPNGRLDAVWVDTRESLQPNLGRLYYRASSDGGDTWSDEVILGPTWNSWVGWPNQNKIGDYYDMESDDVGASLAFSATYNGEQDVYFLRIGPEDCNRNGVADDQEIAGGAAEDCNGNGIPDSCEYAAGTLVHADADGDHLITPADVAAYVGAWFGDLGAGTFLTDVDRDHAVTPADVAAFVRAWLAALTGPCR